MASKESPSLKTLSLPVRYLRGVGPHRAELLEKLGLRFVHDVLFYFPRDYLDLTDYREVPDLEEGKVQSVEGVIEEIESRRGYRARTVVGILLRCRSGYLRGVWFNLPHIRDQYSVGQRVVFSGKPRQQGILWEMAHPLVQVLGEDESPRSGLLPIYPSTEGLQQWELRQVARNALELALELVEDAFPAEYREAHRLWPIRQALAEIHFPSSREHLEMARRRFIYQELFLLQLALAIKRAQQQAARRAPSLLVSPEIDRRIRRLFPFELTPGQNQVISEITSDMGQTKPMLRLLQGDVGSGKTVVAAYAMLLAVVHGYQTALMAPTEVLARQHARTFERVLRSSRVRQVLLTGGLAPKERETILAKIAAGQVDMVIGTQALIQQTVQFKKLGLVVIDEQHKFGVRQRAALKASGEDPHYLVMTATPIPRTLMMTLFGDLDVSTLRDSPPGRQKVRTFLTDESRRAKWWEFFRRKLREGRQGYVVTPVVEDDDELDLVSLERAYEALSNGELEGFRLGLIHGRMPGEQKESVMEAFRRGKIQVLACTSVIEVGIDVPNATLMTIENAERFGLAQLHQLRGRISRGSYPGYCCLFTGEINEQAKKRLQAFAAISDGFELAEIDFALRGPGELFGTKQHGMPPMKIADFERDHSVLLETRDDARKLVERDPGLANPAFALLRRQMLARYGRVLDLGDVG